jgi:hypothetical protein
MAAQRVNAPLNGFVTRHRSLLLSLVSRSFSSRDCIKVCIGGSGSDLDHAGIAAVWDMATWTFVYATPHSRISPAASRPTSSRVRATFYFTRASRFYHGRTVHTGIWILESEWSICHLRSAVTRSVLALVVSVTVHIRHRPDLTFG